MINSITPGENSGSNSISNSPHNGHGQKDNESAADAKRENKHLHHH